MPKKELYIPRSGRPFRLSRSKLDLFLECPRCFYLDRRIGVSRPSSPPLTLNTAVDGLLKKEFDACRRQGLQHPVQKQYAPDTRPARHPQIDDWRRNLAGVRFLHPGTNFLVFGAIDDLWQNSDGRYHVVDYKATAKAEPVLSLDRAWHAGYKRQIEVYQWLLRKNGLDVSDRAYFLYCNGKVGQESFGGRLEFDLALIPYDASDAWVEDALREAKACLDADQMPESARNCEFCGYVRLSAQFIGQLAQGKTPWSSRVKE
ncbi:MAG: hypothetical protein OHK006_08190 [Thermodesulfovibrionales bacterium]